MKQSVWFIHFSFACLFFLGTALPFALSFSPVDPKSEKENRLLARAPRFGSISEFLAAFPRELDEFLNDHFGFREQLARVYYELSSAGPLFSYLRHEALVGKDGWLYWAGPEGLVDIRGTAERPTREEFERWKSLLIESSEWMKEKGAKMLVVVAADKPSIYPEHLPDGIRAPHPTTQLDQLNALLGTERFPWLMDLREPMLEAKKHTKDPLYFRADSHWNNKGAYFGYEAILKRLRTLGLDVKSPFREADFVPSADDNSAEFNYIPDRWALDIGFANQNPALGCIRNSVVKPIKAIPELEKKSQVTTCDRGRYTALVIGDSFTERLKPLYSSTFARVIYISNGVSYYYTRPIVESEKPDVVIFEVVERRLALKGMLWGQQEQFNHPKVYYQMVPKREE